VDELFIQDNENYKGLAQTFPLAEALELVKAEFAAFAPLNNPIVYVIASQLPQPVPVGINYGAYFGNGSFALFDSLPPYWNNNEYEPGAYPETWYPSVTCIDESSSHSCSSGPYSYPTYLNKTYNAAKALTDMGVEMSITLVPSGISGQCPSSTFFLGQQDISECSDDITAPGWPLAYDWCALYPVDGSGSWSDAVNCHCTFVQATMAFDTTCVSLPTLDNLLAAAAPASCGVPTKSPTRPTIRPTHIPTPPTTFAPNPPTVSPFCNQLTVPLPNCGDFVGRDVLFVVDKADSNNQTFLRNQLQTFAEQLTCTFDDLAGSYFGMISYGFDVRVEVRLGRYTQNEWYTQMENLRNSTTLNLNGGLSPLAEALELALREMQTYGDPNHYQIILVMSSTQPQPIDQYDGDVDYPSAVASDSSSIFPNQYYPYVSCDPFCNTYSYNNYLGNILPNAATNIKNAGINLMVMALPNVLGVVPDMRYMSGKYVFALPYLFNSRMQTQFNDGPNNHQRGHAA